MNKYHREILEEIKKHAGKGTKHSWDDNYLGSGHTYYNLSNPLRRQIIKVWLKDHKDLSLDELIKLLDSLYKGDSYEEKTVAGMFWGCLPKIKKKLDPKLLDNWLSYLNGWAEVDTTCQSNFTAEELLSGWDVWKNLIIKLSKDKNINKRRASLVLLTGVVRKSEDKRLSNLAFEVIDRLKLEKDILITKAISWLLRDLIMHNRKRIKDYLEENKDSLPKIAIRETARKLLTGKK